MRVAGQRLQWWVRALLVVVAVGPVAKPGYGQAVPPDDGMTLAPGDAIRLTFWREPTLNGEYQIDETGSVTLPILGGLRAVDVSSDQLLVDLREAYARELAARQDVSITLLRRVRILGAVAQPGLYHVDPTMTLADAIALAGGATREGKLQGVRIVRDGQPVFTDLSSDVFLAERARSGDQIVVPERSWFSRNSAVVVGGLLSATALIVANALVRSNN